MVKPGTTFRQILEYRVAARTFFDDIDECIDELTAKMRAGEELVLVMEVNDGRTYCVTNRPTGDGGWVSTHEDITERMRGERELQRARNMLRAVVENIPEMLVVKDAHSGRYVFINRAGEELLGVGQGPADRPDQPRGIQPRTGRRDRRARPRSAAIGPARDTDQRHPHVRRTVSRRDLQARRDRRQGQQAGISAQP